MINLLPSQEKEVLVLQERFKISLILSVLFLLFLLFFAPILFLLENYISNQITLEKEKTASYRAEIESSEIRSLKEQVSSSNAEMLKINSFFQDQFFFADLFENLTPLFPNQTYLTSLAYRGSTGKFAIIGFAPTREILFELKENFESGKKIKDLNFPPSNWVDSKDINFNLGFEIYNR